MPKQADGLVESLAARMPHVAGSDVAKFRLRVAGAQPEGEPAVRQQVERCRLLGHDERIAHPEHDHRRAKSDPAGARREIAQKRQRFDDPRIAILEVGTDEDVVERPDTIEPQLLGGFRNLRELAQGDAAMSVRQGDMKVHR